VCDRELTAKLKQKLAEEKYIRSLELNPDAVNAEINLAELYAKQGRLEEAGAMFKKVRDFYPVTEYVVRYAYIQIALNNTEEAISAVGYYLGDDLDHPDISALAGTAYFVKGDYKMALFFLKRAVELGNTTPEIKEMIKISEENL
jgi:tetratricopeptide (TPR) repeat protein